MIKLTFSVEETWIARRPADDDETEGGIFILSIGKELRRVFCVVVFPATF